MDKNNIVEVNRKSKTTVLFIQGGPVNWLVGDPNNSLKDAPKGLKGYYWLVKNLRDEVFKDFNFVQVKQVQNIKDLKEISLKDALELQKENIQIIRDVVINYKKLGHKVILFGQSYGGYIIQEYLAIHGTILVDKVIIGNSRLNIPLILPTSIDVKNTWTYFGDDNKISHKEELDDPNRIKRLLAVLAYNRYCWKLNEQDMSKVMFVTCKGDKMFGSLDEDEIKWIEQKGGNLISHDIEFAKEAAKEFGEDVSYQDVAHRTSFHKDITDKLLKWI